MNGATYTSSFDTSPTKVEQLSSSPQSFHHRSSGSVFSKDYSYSPDNRESRKTTASPRTIGSYSYDRSSYHESKSSLKETSKTTTLGTTPPKKTTSFDESPLHLDVLSSSPRRATGFGFAYKPPSSEEIKMPGSGVSPIISPFDKSPLAHRTDLRGTMSSSTDIKEPTPSPRSYHSSSLNRSEELAKARRQFLETSTGAQTPSTLDRTSATPSRTSLGAISSTSSPRITSSLASRSYSSPKITQKDTFNVPMSGRMSRQSRESTLDSTSSSSVSSDSDSMVDEYEKDDSRQEAATLAGSALKPSATLPSRLTALTITTSPLTTSTFTSTTTNASLNAARSAFFSSEKPPTAPKPSLAKIYAATPYSSAATSYTSSATTTTTATTTNLFGSSRYTSTAPSTTTSGYSFTTPSTTTKTTSGLSPTGNRPWVERRDNLFKRTSPSTDAAFPSVTSSSSYSPLFTSTYTPVSTYTPGSTSLFGPSASLSSATSKSPTSTSGIGSSLSTGTTGQSTGPVPRFTHLSRKRIVTNADGSVEETEEVLEPSKLSSAPSALASTTSPKLTSPFYPSSSPSPSKPIVVGVVPNTSFASSLIDTAQANSTLDTATYDTDTASAYFSSVRLFNSIIFNLMMT